MVFFFASKSISTVITTISGSLGINIRSREIKTSASAVICGKSTAYSDLYDFHTLFELLFPFHHFFLKSVISICCHSAERLFHAALYLYATTL